MLFIVGVSEDPVHPSSCAFPPLIHVYPPILRLCACVVHQVLPEFMLFSNTESLKVFTDYR